MRSRLLVIMPNRIRTFACMLCGAVIIESLLRLPELLYQRLGFKDQDWIYEFLAASLSPNDMSRYR